MKRLYLRIYLAVLASIVLSVLLAGLAWRIFGGGESFFDRQEFFAEAAQAMLPPASAPAAEQKQALEKWSGLAGVGLALVGKDGQLIAGAGRVDIGPAEGGRFRPTRDTWFRRSVELKDGRILIGQRAHPRGRFGGPMNGPPGLLVILGLIAVSVAIAAWPVVRRLTRNLERLEAGVAAFGAGDLSRRVDVAGRDEVARLAQTFNQTASRIETLVQSNKTLLANASHELRSPLARLRMAAEALGDRAPPDMREEISRNVRELDQLVEEILTASRLDGTGPGNEAFEEIDLVALAAEEAARTGAELEAVGAVPPVKGNPRLMRRLVRNLLENAQRYGGAMPAEISVTAQPGGRVRLAVCDRGPGVPEADREKIFEPFYRRSGASEASGGVGLGLALVRQIAEGHGGTVRCEPREGGGACFVVEV
ncbi:MAG: sensor histidine kinase [Beijerinckiaceae bacterium]